MNSCYYYKCRYNTSGCSLINEHEYNKNNLENTTLFNKDKNVDKTHKICHPFHSFLNQFFILTNNK